ncbi:MAG: S1 RNA-binding domain-containing protein [Anaerolineales bacterium]|nr:S1 RNA-binding domain-containing protein [Anaerolineales bacterium]
MLNTSKTIDSNEPFTSNSMTSLLEAYEPEKPQRGQLRQGIILQVEDDSILLDIGAKRDAIVSRGEYARLSDEELLTLSVGQEVPVYIMRTPVDDAPLLVSIKRGEEYQDWQQAQADMENEAILTVKVTAFNRGGLEVRYRRLTGFIPNSLITGTPHRMNQNQLEMMKRGKVASTVSVKIIEVNRHKRRLIFSCRAAEQETRRQKIEALHVGTTIRGHVVNIVEFGAFVDLGGVDGLIHISKLCWEHVSDPADVVTIGEEIEVLIEAVDRERERISLSRKALLPNPWENVLEHYNIGEIIAGTVTNVRNFGAFVRLHDGIEALIHESEMAIIGDAQPCDVLKSGDKVNVRIINIEPQRERCG